LSQDTIAAIVTALSESGISIIRVSGPDAIPAVNRIFKSKVKKSFDLSQVKTHTIHFGTIIDNLSETIDEVLVSVMRAPKSYTCEDVVEINCHGGVLITRKIFELVVSLGIRIAEPGEFTKRAFLNGRIDLSEAEAVMDLIQAKNEFTLKNSISQLSGLLYHWIIDLRENILYEIAFIESAIDDPENYDLYGYSERLQCNITDWKNRIDSLVIRSEEGRILKEGINTCIIGKPNAGKSSFLNQLLGVEKAIVTEIAGTTRDIIEETIQLDGFTLNLYDTAGIRSTDDIIEKIGVEKALQFARNADLIFYMIDSTVPLDEDDDHIIEIVKEKPCIILLNKSDLQVVVEDNTIREKINEEKSKIIKYSVKNDFVSLDGKLIKKENGIEYLKSVIREVLFQGNIEYNDQIIVTNMRQIENLKYAMESLKQVQNSIENGLSEDFYTIDLMNAYSELGKLIGEEVDDDLVNEIFSKFCMGK